MFNHLMAKVQALARPRRFIVVATAVDMADMLMFVLEAANYLTPLVFDNPRIYCFGIAATTTAYCDASSSSCHIT